MLKREKRVYGGCCLGSEAGETFYGPKNVGGKSHRFWLAVMDDRK